ncbi:MAG: glycosyltransferase [Rhodanobacteraceae bacterium]
MSAHAAIGGTLSAPLSEVAWNGHALQLLFDAPLVRGGEIALDIDGCFFGAAHAASDARVRFDFPFSPSGRAAMRVMPRLGRDGPNLAGAWMDLTFGAQGLAPASDTAPAPLRLLAAAQLLPYGSDCARREVVIVVPVYDAVKHVGRCLEALVAHTRGRARLLLIDDASPDPAIAPLLERHARLPGVTALCNARNLGFTATANRGIAAADRADVILLNADTEVGPNWLTGLRRAAYARDDIGSATAVSDNAGAFSVPELEQTNALPASWSLVQTARALWQHAGQAYPELPTGNGFCLYLKRAMLDAVGSFDQVAFPRGYGEENDLCQRASMLGWHHVIAGNVFVGHARSQSFGDRERDTLGRAGMAALRERYPDYETQIEAALFSFERRVLDWRVRRLFSDARSDNAPLPRLLWFGDAPPRLADWSVWHLCQEGDALLLKAPDSTITYTTVARGRATTRLREALWNWLQIRAFDQIGIGADDSFGLGSLANALELPVMRPGSDTVATKACADSWARSRTFAGTSA